MSGSGSGAPDSPPPGAARSGADRALSGAGTGLENRARRALSRVPGSFSGTPAPPLLDAARLRACLAAADGSPQAVAGCFRQVVGELQDTIARQFGSGVSASVLVHARSEAVDCLLVTAWEHHGMFRFPELSLVAVGGYGRGELHPCSDVDLLILVDAPGSGESHCALAPPAREAVERFVTFLFDIGLDIGHSVRTPAQCVEEAAADITVATNLMEARLLAGRSEALARVREETGPARIWPSEAYFRAKQREQQARYQRHHGTGYNLEPNVKEGPGGLRDIQMVGWVVKRHYGADTLAELVTHGFLTRNEYDTLLAGQDFLWRVRMALHLLAGRREDRLLFHYQREIAERFGYRDAEHNLAVEHFMKVYYQTITELSRLNEMLLQLFQELFLEQAEPATIVRLNKRFQTRNGYLEVTSEGVFRRYPFALLELFLILQQNPQIRGVRASTIRLVRDHRYLIDDDFRNDLACRSLFLEIIRQPRGITHELRRMHSYGVLGAYLPAFGRIEGLMQFDLFHAYTVDEHVLFTVRNLRQFAVPEHYHELPHCSDVLPRLPKPELLYLAGLFHDIAKGRGGDHSELGAEDAIAFCRHHGISHFDAQLVAWLVRNHLVMSTTAQRQDISDPEVVRDFATLVADPVRLDYLYLLTVADIRATNPDLWTDWKDSLLWELYRATHRVLRHGPEALAGHGELAAACRAEAMRRLLELGHASPEVNDLWESLGEDYFVRNRPEDVAWHTSVVLDHRGGELPVVAVRTLRRNTEVFLYDHDRDYLFAATATVLERLGLTVLDARIFTSSSGMTFDSWVVAEADGSPIRDEGREREIQRTLARRLREPEKAIYPVNRLPRRQLEHFRIPTQVSFETDPGRGRTLMEVVTADRPGLLSRIGWALVGADASLQTAKIATFGARAEDLFYLTSRQGGPLAPAQQEFLRERIQRALASRDSRPAGPRTVDIGTREPETGEDPPPVP